MSGAADAQGSYQPRHALDLRAIVSVFRHGPSDPTSRVIGSQWWFAWHTPIGPVSLSLDHSSADRVWARAWGAGASWALDQLPDLLGARDCPDDFRPASSGVAELARRFPGWRVPRSGLIFASLVPAILEQKVTGAEAQRGYAALVRRFGTRAPGAGGELGLILPPTPSRWASIPSWDWLKAGVDPARSRTVMAAASVNGRLERLTELPGIQARAKLESVPGIGVWTSAEVAQRALGDSDAVSFGDYHVARNVGWALTGSLLDDDGLAELLEPYAGHRYRIQRWVELAGLGAPRRGSRMPLRNHLPIEPDR